MKPEMDTERLIEAIRRRPLLYNKSDAMYYSHKKHKAKIWTDVCREVFLNWETYRAQDKVEYHHELQKRWKSLRTCFTRELALQKKEIQHEKDGKSIKRRKRYEYFETMSFLLHPDIITETDLTRDDDENSSDPLETFKTENLYEEPTTATSDCPRIPVQPNEVASTHMPFYERNDTISEEKIVEIIRELKKDEEDADRQFMLSLVPCFRKLKDKQKFEARIKILKVLQEVTFHEKDS